MNKLHEIAMDDVFLYSPFFNIISALTEFILLVYKLNLKIARHSSETDTKAYLEH